MYRSEAQWQYGLFSCLGDCKTCCISACCPCVQFGINQQHIHRKEKCAPDCITALFAMTCFWPLFVCLECQSRSQTRKKFGIEGSPVNDCNSVTFCRVCTQTQEYRELIYQRDKRLYPPIPKNRAEMEPQPQMQMKVDQVPSSSKDNGQEHVQMEEISRRKEADPDPDKKDDGKEVKTSPSTHKNDEKDLKDDGREGASVPGRHIDRKGKGKEVVDETPGFEPDESKLPNEGHEKSANRHAGRGTANFKAGDQTASESGTLARKGKNYVIERIDKFTRTYVPRNLSNPSVDEFGNPQSPGFTFNLIQVNITKRDRFQ